MALRKFINRHPLIIALTSTIVVGAMVVFALIQLRQAAQQVKASEPQDWYTIDDGKSWFADRARSVVPFQQDGKPAYPCFVWTCDGGKTLFVTHLERIKPSAMKYYAGKELMMPYDRIPASEEIKAPLTGDSGWIDPS